MAQVERIRLRVWGSHDLSGEYTLNPDSSLSLPMLGRLDVGKMTTTEAEHLISEKLSELTRSDVAVAVEVDRYRPAFVVGQVMESGAIAWRPGLKVIQALALARGVLRPSAPATMSQGQIRSQLTFSLAQLARLKAERDGLDTIDMDARIAAMISSLPEDSRATLHKLTARQNEILREQRDLMRVQVESLEREHQTALREVEAAEKQERAVREQVEIARSYVTDIEDLRKRQLVTKSHYISQKTDLLGNEVRYAEANSLLERARARLSSVERQLATVPQQRRASLNDRIDTLERDVAHLELASTASAEASEVDVTTLSYTITRERDGAVQTINANVFTEMLPGDVLIVAKSSAMAVVSNAAPAAPTKQAEADVQRMIEAAAVGGPAATAQAPAGLGGPADPQSTR